MRANELQLIRLGDDQLVLKRGVTEVLLEGSGMDDAVEKLVALLGEGRHPEEVVEAFPEPERRTAVRLMRLLFERRLLGDGTAAAGSNGASLQASFYDCFGIDAESAQEKLEAARVVVYGANVISHVLVTDLLDVGVGDVTVVVDPVLSNEFADGGWLDGIDRLASAPGKVAVTDSAADPAALEGSTLLCATSDLGEPEHLEELNRQALAAGTLFLPAWVSSLVGFVGPLVHPFDTACYRCYRLRADANDPRHDVSRAVRRHSTTDPAGRASPGFLPPMARIVGEIAAMEVLKVATGVAPSDVAGRVIRINLVSFESHVHRVLKVPRCPDCSDVMKRSATVTTTGPQIPFRQ